MIQLDVIGTLYTPGTYDAQGNEITAPVAQAGYHVNTTHPVAAWAAKRVTPATPRRIFGGGQTVFYAFDDEAEYLAALEGADLSEPVPAPVSVTPRQIRQALTQAGLRNAVEAAVAAADQDTKDWWAASTAFERTHPRVQAMAAALGVSDAQLEALWTLAASL